VVSDAVTTVTSEKLRDVTWVIVNTVRSGSWGVGGTALGVEDVRKIMRGGALYAA
jgi:4-oxalocrotonate tautomerase